MENKDDVGLYRYGTPVIEQIYNNVIRLLKSKMKHVDLAELTGISSQMIGYMRKTLREEGNLNSTTIARIMQLNSAFETPEKIEYIKEHDEDLYHYILPQLMEISDKDKEILGMYKDRYKDITVHNKGKRRGGGNYIVVKCPHCNEELTFCLEMKLKQ